MSARALQIPRTEFAAAARLTPNRCVVLVVIVGIAIMIPAMIFGVPSSRDLSNHFRFALPFYDALRSGRFYPGWLAESNAGYGDASFRFYPPALYYFLALTRTLTGNWYSGTLLAFTSLFVAGALGVYWWARTVLPVTSAMWAAIFFTLAPYHLNQFYQSSLLAEFAACSILPFSFLFIERICRRRSRTDIAGLAISYALLALTHLPLTVIGSLAILVYALLRLPRERRGKTLVNLGLAAGLGLAASCCYWLTMLAEKNLIRADRVQPDPSVYYGRNFIFSTFSPDNLNVWWANILTGLTLLMLVPALVLCFPRARRSLGGAASGSVALLFTLAILMTTQVSLPVWRLIGPLQETQFPWRWLAIVSLAGSLLFGASIPFWARLSQSRKRPLVLLAFAGVFIAIAFSLSHIVREAKYLPAPDFIATLQSIPGSASVTQWLPVWAADNVRPMQSNVEVTERSVRIDAWEPEHRAFQVNAGKAATARIKTFYYPYWTATAGSQRLSTSPAEDGALLISVPSESTAITLEFREPTRVRVARAVAACGWLAILALLIPSGSRKPERLSPLTGGTTIN